MPLQAKAVEALDRLRASVNPILFPNARGGRIDFRVFGRRHWRPAQIAAGVEPIRGLYDLRHTYATFALRAGVPVFAVSRFIGSSIAMIDRHYGHLARDSHVHAVSLLDALAFERAVDATWTSNRSRAIALINGDSKSYRRRTHRRVDSDERAPGRGKDRAGRLGAGRTEAKRLARAAPLVCDRPGRVERRRIPSSPQVSRRSKDRGQAPKDTGRSLATLRPASPLSSVGRAPPW